MKFVRLYLVLLLIISVLVGYLYFETKDLDTKLTQNIEVQTIKHISYIAKNIEALIKKKTLNAKDLYHLLKNNPYLRKDLEDYLSILVTPVYKYIYVVYKDSKGRFRYLLDGSKEDRGEFNQRIEVRPEWNKIFKTKKPLVIPHQNSDILWITYLYPYIVDNEVEAVIAIDFSTKFKSIIEEILKPLHLIILFIFSVISFLISIVIFQIFLYLKAKKEAQSDQLTGLYNRTFLREFLNTHSLQRYAIFMLDIDHFKQINDNYGHKAGDLVLKKIASILQNNLREKDLIIRYGGEEFLIFVHKEDLNSLLKLAERIRKVIESTPIDIDGHTLHITASIGINLHPDHFKEPSKAIRFADELLYEAKRTGRNKIVYEKKRQKGSSTTLPITLVQDAIEKGGLFCQFQPIVDIFTKETIKYEALVRLRYNDTIYYPNQFLDEIQFTTTYNLLTQHVLEIVFEKIKKTGNRFSVNLNLSDILDNKLFDMLLTTIEKNRNIARNLTLEILEYEGLSEISIINEKLEKLRSYKVQIAIDDFGSGYSNFTIFKELPIDTLKIDGSLIKSIEKDRVSRSIVKAIANFAHNIDIQVIAEFVENEHIVQILQKLGIRYAQGYYFSKPIDL